MSNQFKQHTLSLQKVTAALSFEDCLLLRTKPVQTKLVPLVVTSTLATPRHYGAVF